MTEPVDALLSLHRGGRLLVARDRVALLEAIAENRSITKGAQVLGYSYKTAWDAVNAINNLLPHPAFILKTGGRSGGGAEITQDGRRLLDVFHRLETQLARVSAIISETGLEHAQDLFWGVGARTSARNAFYCTVLRVDPDPVDVVVTLRLSDNQEILAIVTNGSVRNLQIEPGRPVVALVKASSVILSRSDEIPRLSARNKIPGTVTGRADGAHQAEITLDIGDGKTITSVITREGADELELAPGTAAHAIFKSSSVILASD